MGQTTTRNEPVALNVVTGNAILWAASGTNPATIRALASSRNPAQVAGTFQNIGGEARTNLAAIGATTGEASSWSPFVTNPASTSPRWQPILHRAFNARVQDRSGTAWREPIIGMGLEVSAAKTHGGQ